MTIGQLVAFNMLANQMSGPIVRIAQLWTSLPAGGDFHGAPGRHSQCPGGGCRPEDPNSAIVGAIEFDKVSFRYRPETPEVLREVSFKIAPGEVIGIVGRSGSGKSTLAKLIQRLYVPERGRVMIDGQDLSIIDTASCAISWGWSCRKTSSFYGLDSGQYCLAQSRLADRTHYRQRRRWPGPMTSSVNWRKAMTPGSENMVRHLSGGQRQRIAIARALITNPRILIFDEATSALDYESEMIIQQNMRKICAGRTVVIIAHRLSAVRDANRIFVMDRGQIVEQGSHDELMVIKDGIYAHLHQLQFGLNSGKRSVGEG